MVEKDHHYCESSTSIALRSRKGAPTIEKEVVVADLWGTFGDRGHASSRDLRQDGVGAPLAISNGCWQPGRL
jgi:hypothetical protein